MYFRPHTIQLSGRQVGIWILLHVLLHILILCLLSSLYACKVDPEKIHNYKNIPFIQVNIHKSFFILQEHRLRIRNKRLKRILASKNTKIDALQKKLDNIKKYQLTVKKSVRQSCTGETTQINQKTVFPTL